MPPQKGIYLNPLGSDALFGGSVPGAEDPTFGWAMEEKGIGNMLSLIPELASPELVKDRHSLDDNEDISEATLAMGFTFRPREPPRPGQFSNIPQHAPFTKPLNSPPLEPNWNPPTSPAKDKIADSKNKASPLNLPEICLLGNPRNIDTVEKHGGEADVSQHEITESRFFTPPDITRTKGLPQSRSCSPKQAHETHEATSMLPSPKLTSAPMQSQRNSMPHAMNHKTMTSVQDSAYHAPKKPSLRKTKISNTQRQSTPSVCGDLEGPSYRSPRSQHRYPRKPKGLVCRPLAHSSVNGYERRSHQRSNSTTSSNISKKRSAISTVHLKPALERTELAMQEVTLLWNEIVQISQEQKHEAQTDIQMLQDDLQAQGIELEKAGELLNQKDAKLSEVEELNHALITDNARAAKENEDLASELASLREQLSENKKQEQLSNSKHDDYRSKLNDAIRQQETFSRRIETFYKDAIEELQKQNKTRAASEDEVDKALKNSLKIREEMKRCTEEYRVQMERDIAEKNKDISKLKDKLILQENLLSQEKSFTNKLLAQAEDQITLNHCVRELEAKIDSLIAHQAMQNEQRELDAQQNAQTTSTLGSKLDSLLVGGNLLASKMLSPDTLELKLAAAEKSIVKSILSSIALLENGQGNVANAMSQLQASIGRDLALFKDEAGQMTKKLDQTKEGDSMRFQKLLSLIQTLNSSLMKTENSCEGMRQRVDVLCSDGQSKQRETINMLQDLSQRVSASEINPEALDYRFQQTREELAKSIRTVISEAMSNREETSGLLKSAATEIRATLEQGLGQEREKMEKLLQGSEDIFKALTAHINEQKQLATQTDDKTCELQATLKFERESAVQLRREIQELEHQVQETENLRDQWLRDVQVVDKLRSQLKAVEMRIPQVENCDKKLDRIVEISRSIQSSASYLATEREWVQLELASIAPNAVTSEPIASCEITASTLPPNTESITREEVDSSIKEDAASRKVTVHSPDPGEGSPFPPLTVMQEQKRRREVTQLRSILKSHAIPGAVEDGHSIRPQTNHGKMSQPSNGSVNKSTSASAKEMVAEIRSRLVQHDWSFPTVADFERDNQLTGKRQAPQGNSASLESFEASHRDVKKLRAG